MRDQEIETPSASSFGYLFGLIFVCVSFYPLLHNNEPLYIFLILGLIFLFLGYFKPSSLKILNKLWFKLGIFLGSIVSPIILFLVFLTAFCTTSLIFKILRKDLLDIKFDKKKSTYWQKRNKKLEPFNEQY